MVSQLEQQPKQRIAVIFAGGDGKRLWPISTHDNPKQLNSFFSETTLVVEAYQRATQLVPAENVLIVTTQHLVAKITQLLPINPKQVIAQPKNMDTFAAVAMAALVVEFRYLNPLVVMLYSDHLVQDIAQFKKDVTQALTVAEQADEIITIGTKPTSASTEMGYIEIGHPTNWPQTSQIVSFTEKPDASTAQSFADSGRYLWNTGAYVWSAQRLLSTIKQQQSAQYQQLVKLRASVNDLEFDSHLNSWYQNLSGESFEKSISERLDTMLVFEASYNWLDIGNWRSVYDISKKDSTGNALISNPGTTTTVIDTHNCLVFAQVDHVGVIGLSDLIIIQTHDRLLVCDQSQAGRVKELVHLATSNQ